MAKSHKQTHKLILTPQKVYTLNTFECRSRHKTDQIRIIFFKSTFTIPPFNTINFLLSVSTIETKNGTFGICVHC